MILHRLGVRHWRALLGPVELGPFADGLNVIHAPNGTGKSSLFEALRRALFDAHHVSGAEIEAIRPWGRALAPQVSAEFSQGGVRYRIEKTFLDSPSAHLARFEHDRFVPLADARNADARLREILEATEAPGRGLSKPEHWGLAQVLWAPQGALGLESVSSSVAETLRAALGVQLTGEGGGRLEELLEEAYEVLFTRAGKTRTGREAAPIVALEAEQAQVAEERRHRLEQHQQFEAAARAVEDARQRRDQARLEADALRETVIRTRRAAEVYQRLQAELEQRRQAEQAARERHEALGRTLELIVKTRAEIGRLETDRREHDQGRAALEAELKTARDRAEDRRRQRDAARQQRASLEQRAADLEDARAFLNETRSLGALAVRLRKAQQLDADRVDRRSKRAALVAPDDKTIREVRRCLAARDKADALVQAALIRLTVWPEQPANVRCESSSETHTVPAGGSATFTGSPTIRVQVQGFGRLEAAGPDIDIETHRRAVQEAERKLTALTQPYATADPDRLQFLRDQAAGFDRELEVLEAQLAEVLGESTTEALLAQRAELEARLAERRRRFPAWNEQPPILSELQAALDRQRRTIETAIDEAESALEKSLADLQGLERNHAGLAAAARSAALNLEAAGARLADLTRDGQSDEARGRARQEALMAWEAARTHALECERRLAEIGDDPRKPLEKLERQLAALEAAETQARDEEKQAEGRLQTLANDGAYSRLAACEERLADVTERVRRERLRMDALRLLYETVKACKARVVAAVAAPVERVATRMLERVAGTRLGQVRLTGQFVPAGVQPEVLPAAVGLENLSGGELEQLFLIARLALGQVLARKERQLVVLDDVLNATDTWRLARLLALIEEATDRLQIVVLTCHPERYRACDQAVFFELKPHAPEATHV